MNTLVKAKRHVILTMALVFLAFAFLSIVSCEAQSQELDPSSTQYSKTNPPDASLFFNQGVDPELNRDWDYIRGRYIIPALLFLGGVVLIFFWLDLANRQNRRKTHGDQNQDQAKRR